MEFAEFPKMARLSRECTISEKIDGTNSSIFIDESGLFLTGSRTRWITPEDDNFGFSRWAHEHKDELMKLGPGHHFGEWWGGKIQRGYGLKEKRFSLFNSYRWQDDLARPACCSVVPVLYQGLFHSDRVTEALENLISVGSIAAPGFMSPEGVVVWHDAARMMFKKTILKDEGGKGQQ